MKRLKIRYNEFERSKSLPYPTVSHDRGDIYLCILIRCLFIYSNKYKKMQIIRRNRFVFPQIIKQRTFFVHFHKLSKNYSCLLMPLFLAENCQVISGEMFYYL